MSTTPTEELAQELLRKFEHMATRDGGRLSVATVAADSIRFDYRPGSDADCSGDECVLPGAELETLLRETLARRRTDVRVAVDVV